MVVVAGGGREGRGHDILVSLRSNRRKVKKADVEGKEQRRKFDRWRMNFSAPRGTLVADDRDGLDKNNIRHTYRTLDICAQGQLRPTAVNTN